MICLLFSCVSLFSSFIYIIQLYIVQEKRKKMYTFHGQNQVRTKSQCKNVKRIGRPNTCSFRNKYYEWMNEWMNLFSIELAADWTIISIGLTNNQEKKKTKVLLDSIFELHGTTFFWENYRSHLQVFVL